ncbi:hypothetical protein CEXT_503841 [Caerostris extrusa]|uniref:Uncharacterized protein n=1 Tax=Caerostris extrusa TaxID=172846 RepID=A0AAV4VXL3_CAEEX|nr:hypothetical protein CEXT_503841 [Caerostris extrusa]
MTARNALYADYVIRNGSVVVRQLGAPNGSFVGHWMYLVSLTSTRANVSGRWCETFSRRSKGSEVQICFLETGQSSTLWANYLLTPSCPFGHRRKIDPLGFSIVCREFFIFLCTPGTLFHYPLWAKGSRNPEESC